LEGDLVIAQGTLYSEFLRSETIGTDLVYFVPHSLFGSEFDYTTGTGHGTAELARPILPAEGTVSR
jgi:hypothetical protein